MSKKNQQDEFPSTWSNADLHEMVQAGEVAKQELERRQAYAQGERGLVSTERMYTQSEVDALLAGRMEDEWAQGNTAWHMISDRELQAREQAAADTGFMVSTAINTVNNAAVKLHQDCRRIIEEFETIRLMRPGYEMDYLRVIWKEWKLDSFTRLSADQRLLLQIHVLKKARDDQAVLLNRLKPGSVNVDEINRRIDVGIGFCKGIEKLLSETESDGGKLFAEAIRTYGASVPKEMVAELKGAIPGIGKPRDPAVDVLRELRSQYEPTHGKGIKRVRAIRDHLFNLESPTPAECEAIKIVKLYKSEESLANYINGIRK